ncbi:hypothetical protein EYF80_035538 [Liparis tanakae]|uniref:Uncharacterized protein n=1 Tax=Liparis tanakae TaxID=230148 RepID=A0A4Z2GKW2_9TELE|nr:hypothetical protein EYF80_035538 [Liparis tanakae]
MLTPRRPWPAHRLLGVTVASLTASVLLLYSCTLMGFSTFTCSSSFRASLSWFFQSRPPAAGSLPAP